MFEATLPDKNSQYYVCDFLRFCRYKIIVSFAFSMDASRWDKQLKFKSCVNEQTQSVVWNLSNNVW